jgi:serine O-acetyltransferase
MKDDLRAETIEKFIEIRQTSRSTSVLRMKTEQWATRVLAMIFPEFCLKIDCHSSAVIQDIEDIWQDFVAIENLLDFSAFTLQEAADALLSVRENLLLDAYAALDGDPAAQSLDEVILAYPGFHALAYYRIAHALQSRRYPLIPRIITEFAHRETGIDIHPGAVIGTHCFIDHGTGVVIGETAVVGSHVKIYQGVTLGALSVSKDLANTKRHPTVEDGVVIYANSTILGGDTVIGENSVIGGNSWVIESVPAHSFIRKQP